jgi:hypothetical protein
VGMREEIAAGAEAWPVHGDEMEAWVLEALEVLATPAEGPTIAGTVMRKKSRRALIGDCLIKTLFESVNLALIRLTANGRISFIDKSMCIPSDGKMRRFYFLGPLEKLARV